MGEPENEARLAVAVRQVSKSHHLDGREEGHKPGVIIPGALVLRIREVSVFQHLKVFLDVRERKGVRVSRLAIGSDVGHEFAPVVPGRVV